MLFLNADDYLLPGALERVRHALDEGADADIVYGDIQVIDRDGHAFVERADHTLLHRYMSLHHPAMLFRRELLSALGGYDEAYRLAMDSELVHRAIAQGASLQRVDEVVAAMARGGLSDRYHLESLWEYRRSAVRHGLSGRLSSLAYFVRQTLVHVALQVPGVRDWRLARRAAVSPDRAAGR